MHGGRTSPLLCRWYSVQILNVLGNACLLYSKIIKTIILVRGKEFFSVFSLTTFQSFLLLSSLGGGVQQYECHGMSVEVRGQLEGAGSLLPPYRGAGEIA